MPFIGELTGYQTEAVDRMVKDRFMLVAFDTGVGKTPTAIAAVERLIDAGEIGGGLVIVPSSLKGQWERSIYKFAGEEANVLVVDGPEKRRYEHYTCIKRGEVEYAILNYEQVVNDWGYVRHLPRDFIILDEATAIKGLGSKRHEVICRMDAKYRWALTATPLENRLEEVYSIMEWVDPDLFGSALEFDLTFIERTPSGAVARYKNLPLLNRSLAKRMVRVGLDHPEVKARMPKVGRWDYYVRFDQRSAELYRLVADDLLAQLGSSFATSTWDLNSHYAGVNDFGSEQGQIMSRHMCLQMLCDHPALLKRSAELAEDPKASRQLRRGSAYAAELKAAGLLEGLGSSWKMDTALEAIDEILAADPRNKVVFFSFFKEMLDIMREHTGHHDSVLFTGNLTRKQKDQSKLRFEQDPNCRIFFSSDAGGYGVDLPNANYLLSFDLPWSSGTWKQRNGRIIRLSSEFPEVTLVSFIMEGSIEERMFANLDFKHSVFDAVVEGRGADREGGLDFSLATLRDFLSTLSV